MFEFSTLHRKAIFVMIVMTLGLASCGTGTESAALGQGTVSSITITNKIETSGSLGASQLAQLTWGVTGLVDKVNVSVGQKVQAGDLLATLKMESVPATIITAQSDLAAAQRDLNDLLNSHLSMAQAQQAVLLARKAVEVAQNNLDALSYPRASDVLIKNTQAKIWDAQKQVTIMYGKYKTLQHEPDGDPFKTQALLNLTEAQQTLNDLTVAYNWYREKPSQDDIDEAVIKLDLARAKLADARRERDVVKGGNDPLAVSAAKAKITALQSTVNAMNIIAPFNGEIIAVQAISGHTAKKEDAAVAMVDRNTLKVDAQIDETGISTISIGNAVEASMDSLPGETLKGKVSVINPIGQTVNGLVKYNIVIALEPISKPLMFGATVNLVIFTGEPHSMLAVPLNAVQSDSQGEYVVLVNVDGSTQRIAVQSAEISGEVVTITPTIAGSLKEGDKVEIGTSNSSSNSNNNQGGGSIVPVPGGGPSGGPPPGG